MKIPRDVCVPVHRISGSLGSIVSEKMGISSLELPVLVVMPAYVIE